MKVLYIEKKCCHLCFFLFDRCIIYIELDLQMSHIRVEEEIIENYIPWIDIITAVVIFSLVLLKLRG
jgi:LytS/YehU family sensor histidine kinase